MSFVKSKLTFFSKTTPPQTFFTEYEPQSLNLVQLNSQKYAIDILICDIETANDKESAQAIHFKKIQQEVFKVLIVDKITGDSKISNENFNLIQPDEILDKNNFSNDDLIKYWQQVNQAQQDESYLNLSTELNSQYELIKEELEKQLVEKTNNLIESRKQIFEINNRVEFLRRTLYITSEVKSIQEAEARLNELLTQNNKVTWLKIIEANQVQLFEKDLTSQFDSTFFKTEVKIGAQTYTLFFFKGDKKSYKKTDLDYFKKLSETLQINLSRYTNLLSLQQSERLFDLAFHSSPHYILVIDKDYHVLQANLAVEKLDKDNSDKNRCYEILFDRKEPCTGCHLGEKFQIQNGTQTYRIQSNQFNLNDEDETNYWIHLYENISEQKAMETKFEQSARLTELGLISSSIAHELNNPLGGIISYLQIMKLDLPSNHPFQIDIEMMNQTALRMKKIIEELLVFSRKEDTLQLESTSLHEMVQKNLDLLQMQLKKENLKVVLTETNTAIKHAISPLHFRSSVHLAFQYFLQKLKVKKISQTNYIGLVEVKIFQDQINSYLSFTANLGPHDPQENSNDMTLISLEKSLHDQSFQFLISEPKTGWLQILITLSPTKA